MLFDQTRRSQGTSAVLIQSLPGGGKSHLAREYVYRHLADFPGGVFWIRAKSRAQLAAGYWEIARKVALRAATDDQTTAPHDPTRFLGIVEEWLSSNRHWLLVLDGLQFSHSEELQRCIPDNKQTSIIYTSTQGNVGGDRRFMNPQVIRLPLLSAREAQDLLLLELDKQQPTVEDLKHSMELVQRMGFLPLVIHVEAQRLRATEQPLARFTRAFCSNPKLRGLGPYRAVVDALAEAGAHEALSLMRVVCFLSDHIPVEMIQLGRPPDPPAAPC
jgi:hypothetical protein